MKKINGGIMLLLFFSLIGFTSSLEVQLAPLDASNFLQPSTSFNYTFTFSDSATCTPSIYTESQIVNTNQHGYAYVNISTPFNNSPDYLCEYRNGTLKNVHSLQSVVFKNITTDYIQSDQIVLNGTDINNLYISQSDESTLNVNSSDQWDSLDTPADIALNDLSGALTASKIFIIGGNTITWRFTNPVGGMAFNWSGAATGHLFELIQSGNSVPSGSTTHLIHVEADDVDVTAGHFTHNDESGTALLVDGGIVNFTDQYLYAGTVIASLNGSWNGSSDYSTTSEANALYEPISAHFDASTTVNITCLNTACDWYMNASDSCQYWPSGGKVCSA